MYDSIRVDVSVCNMSTNACGLPLVDVLMRILYLGGLQYLADNAANNTLVKHSIAIETDGGAFSPLGLGVQCAQTTNGGCGMAIAQLKTLAPLLEPIGGGYVTEGGGGADIDPICETGIVCAGWNVLDMRLGKNGETAENNPCINDAMGAWQQPAYDPASNKQYDSAYFWFHHSAADTMETIDPTQLNTNAAALAIWAYSIAELPELLPRDEAAPVDDSNKKHVTTTDTLVICALLLAVVIMAVVGLKYLYPKQFSSLFGMGDSSSSHNGTSDSVTNKLYNRLDNDVTA